MTSHDNVTDIVGRLQDVYGKLTPGAIERADLDGMAFTVADAITDLATLRKQLENAREVIIEANNSLYGSQGYFLSLDGGPPNKYHLAEGIEKLKSNARKALSAIKGDKS